MVLVKDCNYTDEDRMLRDAIVCSALNSKVREKCLDLGDELTSDKAVSIGQNYETSQESMKVIGKDEYAKVHAIRKQAEHYQKKEKGILKPYKSKPYKPSPSTKQTKCTKCGYDATHKVCPAKNKTCAICQKKKYFAAVCRKRDTKCENTHQVEENYSSDESGIDYTHLVHAIGNATSSEWYETVKVEGKPVYMQIDTGAVTSILPYSWLKNQSC
ncbi:uncharacterized protein LOC117103478 [Anneissia japonica]|uniref:uncharacterized protein LOC117103478 n=1 Tax=Anneissia japonica TaxID=1529436 RepID=UPI0014256964|nr:uncharacterized protein LOC117103478 [Anneissia japonica]